MKTAILSAALGAILIGLPFEVYGHPITQADRQAFEFPGPAVSTSKAAEPPLKPGSIASAETDPIRMAPPPPATGVKPPAVSAAEKTYVIGAEDKLEIVVWGNKELSGSFIVAPDGRISMGLINEIVAAGLTRERLQGLIIQRLREGGFLRDPTVTVNITGFNSKKYFIQGEVFHPGSQPLVVPTTVLEALVNAGGFKDFANKGKIRILRGTKTFNFNYNQVINGKHREQNILLEPGDTIIVK